MKIKLLVALMLFATPVLAADFTQPVLDDDGQPICLNLSPEKVCQSYFTLGRAVRNAFDHASNQQGVNAEEKNRRGELSQGLIGAKDPHLLDADKKTIKDAIGNAYPPSLVHKLWNMLDAK